MFELLLVACTGARFCDILASPITYPTEERCANNAALIAGVSRGRHDSTWSHSYRYLCRAGDQSGEWVSIVMAVPLEEGPAVRSVGDADDEYDYGEPQRMLD